MKKISQHIKNILLIITLLLTSQYSFGQSYDASVAMGRTLNLREMNPGAHLEGSYIVFPVIGGMSLNFSSPISINSAIEESNGANYLNSSKLSSALTNNTLGTRFNFDIISFGIAINEKHTITFSSKLKVDSESKMPGDMVNFITNNSLNIQRDYSMALNSDAMSWGEVAVGYSGVVTKNLTVGGRLKYLAGFAYLGSSSNTSMRALSDNTYDLSGNIDIVMGSYNLDTNEASVNVNNGFAMDLGAEYKTDFGLIVGASISDIGYIKWAGETSMLKSQNQNSHYNFKGVTIDDNYIDDDGNIDEDKLDDALKALGDDILETMDIDTITNKSFNTMLTQKYNIYGNYNIDKEGRHNVSLNLIGRAHHKKRVKFGMATTIGYTYSNKNDGFRTFLTYTYDNLFGSKFTTGLVATGKVAQFYISGEFSPKFITGGICETRNLGLNMGLVFLLSNPNKTNFRK